MTAPLPIGAALLDPGARTLSGPGGTARLTPTPLRLLLCLAAVAPRVLPYPEAVAALGDRYGRADAEAVRRHLARVRRALHASGGGAVAEAVFGMGVRLRVPDPVGPSTRMPEGAAPGPPGESHVPPPRRVTPERRAEVAECVRALQMGEGLSRVEIMARLGLSDDQLTHLAALDLVHFAARRVARAPDLPGQDTPEPPGLPPVVVDRMTAARWAAERGLAQHRRRLDLDAVNAKRRDLGLPPFALRERASAGEVRP